MTEQERQELNAYRALVPDLAIGEDHFVRCPECGQAIDCRRLGDVMWHGEPGHRPLALH